LLFGCRGRSCSDRERRNQLLHLFVLCQDLAAYCAWVAQRIADQSEVFRALVTQCDDEARRKTMRHAEARYGDRGAVADIRDRILR
jgi:hypothetical protein